MRFAAQMKKFGSGYFGAVAFSQKWFFVQQVQLHFHKSGWHCTEGWCLQLMFYFFMCAALAVPHMCDCVAVRGCEFLIAAWWAAFLTPWWAVLPSQHGEQFCLCRSVDGVINLWHILLPLQYKCIMQSMFV